MKANWDIVVGGDPRIPEGSMLLRDIGPHDQYATITNAAEEVVAEIVAGGMFDPDFQRLFYWDSLGNMDELLVKGGKFAGFKAGPVQVPFED